MAEIILSICIPLHNRSETAIEHIEKILKNDDERYDIIVSDTSDDGRDLLSVWQKTNLKVKVYRSDSATPAMINWKLALDRADGIFLFHLNDRDILLESELKKLLDFLEEHKDFNGGICKYLPTDTTPILFEKKDQALMNVPFFASHPTGIILNAYRYKMLGGLNSLFSKAYGTHPHDIILGRFSQAGRLFIYTGEIWNYAAPEFYKKNRSGFLVNHYFFEPKERLFELKQNITELQLLAFSDDIKKKKMDQMYKTYLGLATNAYFYVVESEFETAHYGIQLQKYNLWKRYRFSMKVLEMFGLELHFSNKEKRIYKKWLTKTIFIPVLAKYTSKISNKGIKIVLRKIKIKRDLFENAILR